MIQERTNWIHKYRTHWIIIICNNHPKLCTVAATWSVILISKLNFRATSKAFNARINSKIRSKYKINSMRIIYIISKTCRICKCKLALVSMASIHFLKFKWFNSLCHKFIIKLRAEIIFKILIIHNSIIMLIMSNCRIIHKLIKMLTIVDTLLVLGIKHVMLYLMQVLLR